MLLDLGAPDEITFLDRELTDALPVSSVARVADEEPMIDAEVVVDDEPPIKPDPAPATQEVTAQPSTPGRTLADVLQSFMEEKNIRWGELISGLLIVISAIGLVLGPASD